MDIQLEKYRLIEWLINLRDEATISKLKKLQKIESETWDQEISDSEKSFIYAGLKDLEEGNTFTQEEVATEIQKTHGL